MVALALVPLSTPNPLKNSRLQVVFRKFDAVQVQVSFSKARMDNYEMN